MQLSVSSTFILCYFHVCKWKNAHIKDWNALRVLVNFLCNYSGEGRGALMHVYVWEHIVSLYCRIVWWMFTKLGRDKNSMPCTCVKAFWPDPPWGRSRVRQEQVTGSPKKTSFSDKKDTATNRMHSSDLIFLCCVSQRPNYSQML